MRRKTISQTEARRLQKRVAALEDLIAGERRRYGSTWPGGVHVASVNSPDPRLQATVQTARALGHAVVVTEEAGSIKFFALPHPKVPA